MIAPAHRTPQLDRPLPRRSRTLHAAPRRAVSPITVLLVALLFVLSFASACQSDETRSTEPEGWVEIRGKRVAVEIAESPSKQTLGLGERDSLAWGNGMYFVYARPAFYSFWMKGMRFSIDIVWLRKGRIVDMHMNVPFEVGGNGPTMRPQSLVDAVLEVPAGYAAANGWTIGDRVSFERVQKQRVQKEGVQKEPAQ